MPWAKMEKLPPLSYVFSVSLGTGCYRHIRISADNTLAQLSEAILDAFHFDNDHMHAFFMDNRAWSQNPNACFWSDDESAEESNNPSTRRVKLRKLGLEPGRKFLYLFDFGDEWRFSCKVLKELPEETKKAAVVRSVGDGPNQYGDYDGDEDEE